MHIFYREMKQLHSTRCWAHSLYLSEKQSGNESLSTFFKENTFLSNDFLQIFIRFRSIGFM